MSAEIIAGAVTMAATTQLPSILSPKLMHSLGWALLHFLWQGTALAALAAGPMALCRRTSVRYLVGIVALALMLLFPIGTFLLYSQQSVAAANEKSPSVMVWPITKGRAALTASTQVPYIAPSLDALPW